MNRNMAKWKGIIGASFSPDQFYEYVYHLQFPAWRPSGVVLHNTWSPTLEQRPDGLTHQHILNLASFYRDKGWSAGPHLFIDQFQIWVFTPLTTPGVHSPSWNSSTWGVEMVGNYEVEEFPDSVRDNAVSAIATLNAKLGIDSHTLKFHREDPLTTHRDCPGRNVSKLLMVSRINTMLAGWYAGEHVPGEATLC